LLEAEEALARAQRYSENGTRDPSLRALLLQQSASLQILQRRFESAVALLGEAEEICRELGETQLLAMSLVQKAIAFLYSGEAEAAISLLNQAVPMIDSGEDPHLLLAACHNLVRCYIDLDRPEEGLALYFKSKELYKDFKDTLFLLRASWQEGQLLRDLGHLRAAETVLLRTRKGFVERGFVYEVAVVSLDLISVYVKLGAVADFKQMVAETMPVFRSLKIGREALAIILQLQQIPEREREALELISLVKAKYFDKRQDGLSYRKG
jgi:tetratricopeptide (TPR) repeat protein